MLKRLQYKESFVVVKGKKARATYKAATKIRKDEAGFCLLPQL